MPKQYEFRTLQVAYNKNVEKRLWMTQNALSA